MPPYPGFIGPTYRSQSGLLDDRCINLFPEQIESGNPRSPLALMPTPGLSTFATPALARCRGSFAQDGRCFYVIGYKFYELEDDGSLIDRGTVDVNDNPATISSSGDQGSELMITSGRSVYIFNLGTDAFTGPVVGVDADFGAYLDGRFIALDTELSVLRISDLFAGTSWNPLRYRQRAIAPDKWKAMIVANDVIWLMGSETYEVWWNSGASPFPFEPMQGQLFPVGIAAPYSLREIAGSVLWISSSKDGNGQVMLATQYSPRRVSRHGVEFDIQNWEGIDTAESMTYQKSGHNFWCVTSRDDDQTWVYDVGMDMWHERLYWDINPSRPAAWRAWRPLYHAFAFGRHLVGDRSNGLIYDMDDEYFHDADGEYMRRLRRAPHILVEDHALRHRWLRFDMEVGVGLATGQGIDPHIMLRYSDDGGKTWGNEITASIGRMGEFKRQVTFNRLGKAIDRVYEINMTDPVPWRLFNAFIKVG
jgi:hypothetical protein